MLLCPTICHNILLPLPLSVFDLNGESSQFLDSTQISMHLFANVSFQFRDWISDHCFIRNFQSISSLFSLIVWVLCSFRIVYLVNRCNRTQAANAKVAKMTPKLNFKHQNPFWNGKKKKKCNNDFTLFITTIDCFFRKFECRMHRCMLQIISTVEM